MGEVKQLSYQPLGGEPKVVRGKPERAIALPAPNMAAGLPLMGELWERKSTREFDSRELTRTQLSELLWAADGVNRSDSGGRTAPSPHALNEIDVYVALPTGVYRYDPLRHELALKRAVDARNLTGYQDFVGTAPLDLVYVVNYEKLASLPRQLQETFAAVTAGAIAQNVYLYCASCGLGTVLRGWLNHHLLAEALSLNEDEKPLLAQTVGYPVISGVQ